MENNQKVTILQVAEQADVSIATVSRVFNHPESVHGGTCRRVLEAVEMLGYRSKTKPSKPLSPRRHLLVMCLPEISNPFYHEIVKGAKAAAARYNADLIVNEGKIGRRNVQQMIQLLKDINCRGVITLNSLEIDIVNALSSAFPLVQCCEYEKDTPVSSVGIDDQSAAHKVIRYLTSIGKTKIGFVNGPLEYKYARQRKKGYLNAMAEMGLETHPHWQVQLPTIDAEMTFSSVVKLLSMPNPPDAFFAVSDLCAVAVIRAANYYNYKVPNDICVVGFDNIDISRITTPSITTINQPKIQLGYTACDLLITKIEHPESENQHVILETELIIRESTSLTNDP